MAFVYALLVLAHCLVGCLLYCAFLAARYFWRHRRAKRANPQPVRPGFGPAHPFDSSAVFQTISRVRVDYVNALHSRPHPFSHRAMFVSAARQRLAAFAFFRSHPMHDEESGES